MKTSSSNFMEVRRHLLALRLDGEACRAGGFKKSIDVLFIRCNTYPFGFAL